MTFGNHCERDPITSPKRQDRRMIFLGCEKITSETRSICLDSMRKKVRFGEYTPRKLKTNTGAKRQRPPPQGTPPKK